MSILDRPQRTPIPTNDAEARSGGRGPCAERASQPDSLLTSALVLEIAEPRSSCERVGVEIESFCFTRRDDRLPFRGIGSMSEVVENLNAAIGARPTLSGSSVVGGEGPSGSISLEPGGQLEWASPPSRTIEDLTRSLAAWASTRDRVLGALGVVSSDSAVDWEAECGECWPPKPRYEHMRRRYADRGARALTPMQKTAGVHLSFDYFSERDWRMKFRGILSAIPASVVLFSNSAASVLRERYANTRNLLWAQFDPDRTRLPDEAFRHGFDIQAYAEWVAAIPDLTPDLPRPAGVRAHAAEKLGEVFTPLRSKHLLEIRTQDRVPDSEIPRIVEFWAGLLYNADALQELLVLGEWFQSRSDWERVFAEACVRGSEAGGWLADYATEVMRISRAGQRENAYLGTA